MLLGEEDWQRIEAELRQAQLMSSVLLALEAERTFVHLSRSNRLSPSDLQVALDQLVEDLEDFQLRTVTEDLCVSRVIPLVTTPRSLDLLHLRTALWFHQQQPLDRFVSLDAAQNQAARELGISV